MLAAMIGGGFLLHFAVERPLQKLVRKRRKPPAAVST